MSNFGGVDFLFTDLTVMMAILIALLTRRRIPALFPATAAALSLWLIVQAVLARWGFFRDFGSLPPRLALLFVPNAAMIVLIARSKRVREALGSFSAVELVALQSFRIVVEICLYRLVREGRLPELMTFTGRNFDIVVGLTAPLVATALYLAKPWAPRLALAWNGLGFAILANTAAHGMLASPTRFQAIFTRPTTASLAEFPWVWLPGFLVPLALLLHVLSILQLRHSTMRRT